MGNNKLPIYQTLYRYYKNEIKSGKLAKGSRLPSIRQLSKDGAYSRTTVEAAYEMLCADGYVECRPQSGYYVCEFYKNQKIAAPAPAKRWEEPFYRYDFSGKRMDETTFAFDVWRKMARRVMQDSAPFMAYGAPQGETQLRQQIAKYLAAGRGVYANEANILIGAGVQSLLHILCELFDKQRTTVAFEDPGFRKGFRIVKDHGITTVFVKGEQDGIDIERLYASGANVLYISPSHSFPAGATLPAAKRVQLLAWAETVNGFLIEDDYDGELRYSGKPLATLKSGDAGEHVIYLGTFSKLLPPSIRISYMVLPDRLLEDYYKISKFYNQTSSTMEQLTMAKFIEDGLLEKQIRRLRRVYSRKNDAITKAFSVLFGQEAEVAPNDTGLHVTVRLYLGIRAETLCAAAEAAGIHIIPMSSYNLSEQTDGSADVYMSCASIREEDILPAVKELKAIWTSIKGGNES